MTAIISTVIVVLCISTMYGGTIVHAQTIDETVQSMKQCST